MGSEEQAVRKTNWVEGPGVWEAEAGCSLDLAARLWVALVKPQAELELQRSWEW